MHEFWTLVEAYVDRFRDGIWVVGIDREVLEERGTPLLRRALATGRPISDDEWCAGLGIEPLPDDAVA